MSEVSIQSIRQQFPQYDDLSDEQLVDGLYRRFYSDMDRADFHRRIGYTPPDDVPAVARAADAVLDFGRRTDAAIADRLAPRAPDQGPLTRTQEISDRQDQISAIRQADTAATHPGALYDPVTGRGVDPAIIPGRDSRVEQPAATAPRTAQPFHGAARPVRGRVARRNRPDAAGRASSGRRRTLWRRLRASPRSWKRPMSAD